jgi:hypothetical protein
MPFREKYLLREKYLRTPGVLDVAGRPFPGCEDEDPASFRPVGRPWVGCVWEPGPFGHERSAWVRHILVAAQPDLPGYLADALTGATVGGPR